jgi:uridine kinase
MSEDERGSSERVVVIGVAGGTASGKTTLVDQIIHFSGGDRVVVLRQDNYYRPLDDLPVEERALVNFDHPDAIDLELLAEHVRSLSRGESIESPTYDFLTHSRAEGTRSLEPKRVVLVEGILVLAVAELRDLMDLKIFVDTDHDLRLIRRLRRDVEQRGRTFDSVTERYLEQVRPMHEQYVEPSRGYADIVVPNGGMNQVVVGLLTNLIEARNRDRRKTPRGPGNLF